MGRARIQQYMTLHICESRKSSAHISSSSAWDSNPWCPPWQIIVQPLTHQCSCVDTSAIFETKCCSLTLQPPTLNYFSGAGSQMPPGVCLAHVHDIWGCIHPSSEHKMAVNHGYHFHPLQDMMLLSGWIVAQEHFSVKFHTWDSLGGQFATV